MENRNKTPELNKPTGSSPSTTNRTTPGTTPSTTPSTAGHNTPTGNTGFANTPPTGQTSPTAASPQRARDEFSNRSSEVIDQTKQAVTQAYDKTAETLSQSYNQAMEYGRENPGKLTLIAFGAGIGIGLLLAGGFSGGRNSRTTRIAEPAIDALSRIALEFFR
ncbi:MAG TPA: hypothetical protein VF131_15175 [Blastocatellia bacterium]|nr:hypothetical protein [Blastocatellia bacterium]